MTVRIVHYRILRPHTTPLPVSITEPAIAQTTIVDSPTSMLVPLLQCAKPFHVWATVKRGPLAMIVMLSTNARILPTNSRARPAIAVH